MKYQHLFGPVQSRRLGRSLGVDMIPIKTCNANCVYCECGGGKTVTHERKEYIPAQSIIAELDDYLTTQPPVDCVTFAGSGEPTLNTSLYAVLSFVKTRYPSCRTALLTNGILLHLPEVRSEILGFDLVLPSLDAISTDVFLKINRPFPGVSPQQMVDGLIAFSRQFSGQLWIEVFIVPGVNDTKEELSLFKAALTTINPSRVQLNSLDRPGTCSWVKTASVEELSRIAEYLKPLPVEIIARKSAPEIISGTAAEDLSETIIHEISRRPATIEEIAVLCGSTINAAQQVLDALEHSGRIRVSNVNTQKFFSII